MNKQPSKTEAIKSFLNAKTHDDLAKLYSHDMECQVNVAKDGGSKIAGEFKGKRWDGYTDGATTWKPIRIPRNAATDPEFEDSDMTFELDKHAEGIGMTGWDWKSKLSRWVAFDFDAITGHSDKHQRKMTEAELESVKDSASKLPWVTVRRSAGGKGLHLYVFLDPISTENHNEHAALARAILSKMSALSGFDFSSKVDICGSNMWVWHRKMAGNRGLELIKQGTNLEEVPPNWRDHVKVVTGHRKKILPMFIQESSSSEEEDFFNELTGQLVKVPLDDEHKKVIEWLEQNNTQSWWDQDHWMLVSHTYHLKQCHTDLSLRGIFETLAKGTEAGHDHNLFAFPIRGGGWAIRRYSMGAAEADTWDQDGRGWTRCFYNMEPNLSTAARSHGGVEDPSGGFQFGQAEQVSKAAGALGAHFEVPNILRSRKGKLKEHKSGRLQVEIEGEPTDVFPDGAMKGWLNKKGTWIRLFNGRVQSANEIETANYEELVRHIITETGEDYGWVIRGEGNQWRSEPLVHVRTALQSMDMDAKLVNQILGVAVMKCWTLINRPFQSEYPGDRTWNRNAAQFRFLPSQNTDDLSYPTWMKILRHCGLGLNEAVERNPWCKANGIITGADYLKIWIASLFREPLQPLPYLFFYSKEQDTGKSIFHEAISLLVTTGYQRADQSLINQSGFNGELKNAIVCVVEEIDLRKNKDAANRIKDWVTSRQIPIHEKQKTPYHVPNSTHWIQCANDSGACPIFPGDTRVTMTYVGPLEPSEMIPKKRLIPMLEREAADFLAEILRLEIPISDSRLNIPVISTMEKLETENLNKTPLDLFLEDKCTYVPGQRVKFSDLYEYFKEFVDPNEIDYWNNKRFGMALADHKRFPKGRDRKTSQLYVGNIMLSIQYDPSDTSLSGPTWRLTVDPKNQVWLDQEGKGSNGDNGQRSS